MADPALNLQIKIPFPTSGEANIAYEVLRVDKEPPRSQVSKVLTAQQNNLNVCFTAPDPHQLRVGVNGFLDNLKLVCETINNFGPPISSK